MNCKIAIDLTSQILKALLHPKGHLQGCAHGDISVSVCHGGVGYQEGIGCVFLRQIIADHLLHQRGMESFTVFLQGDLAVYFFFFSPWGSLRGQLCGAPGDLQIKPSGKSITIDHFSRYTKSLKPLYLHGPGIDLLHGQAAC